MNAKEIGRRAGRVFSFYLPDNWSFRSQEDQEDYGIDAEIEIITPQDKATGLIFKAQIKGQKVVTIIEEGKKVSFSLSLERLQYYMSNVEIAVILFVIDVTNEVIYWHSLQNDEELRQRMNEALVKEQDSIKVHLLTSNTLQRNNIRELGYAINLNIDWLRLNALRKINYSDIFHKSTDQTVQNWLEQAKDQSFHAYMTKFERLYIDRKYDELLELIQRVFPAETEKKELRFYSALYAEKICEQQMGVMSEDYYESVFDIYWKILFLVRNNKFNKYFQLYSILLFRSWLLRKQIQIDYHQFISSKLTKDDALATWVLESVRVKSSLKLTLNLVKTVRLVNNSIKQNNPDIFLNIFPKLATSIILLVHKLRDEGQKESVEVLEGWLGYCTDLGLKLASQSSQEEIYILFLNIFVSLKAYSRDQIHYLTKARNMLEVVFREDLKKFFLEYLNKLEEKFTNESDEYSLSADEELDFYKKHAKKLGFDFDDPNNEFGQIIKQGLEDYNPQRVLKDCENLLVFNSSGLGIPAKMVGLPSATQKIIHCTEFKYTGGGWILDVAYKGVGGIPDSGFKNRHCINCIKCQPRAEDWKWDSKWQAEMYRDNMELYKKLDSW